MERYGPFITEEDKMVLRTVRSFVEKEIFPVRQQLDEDKDRTLCHHIMDGLAKLGLIKRGFPKSIGGLRVTSAVSVVTAVEEVARGDSGFAIEMQIPAWVFSPAMRGRNEAVLTELAAPFCEDTAHYACMAMTEPAGGCNVESPDNRGKTIRTIAKLDGDDYVINGTKRFPSGAGVAEAYLVVATTDPEAGEEGICLLYCPADVPGLSFGKPENKMGMIYTDVNADIYLDNVRVPRRYRAAGPGADADLFRHFMCWGRLSSAADALGNAQAIFEIVLEFTGTRYYGGKQVRQHSLQAAILADMAIAIESARAYYLMVAYMFDNRQTYGDVSSDYMISKASAAKMYATDVAVNVGNKAMELMGSYGYMKEYHVEKYLRDCKIIQLWEGGSHAGRIDVARGFYPMVPTA